MISRHFFVVFARLERQYGQSESRECIATSSDILTVRGAGEKLERIVKTKKLINQRNYKMKLNKWTIGLAAVGAVSLASVVQAEEKASSLLTAVSSTMLSGYVDTSAQWNFGTGNAHNPGYAFNNSSKADGFNLNVVKLSLEKVADSGDSWGAGYKVDALFGPDANALGTQSSGFGGTDFGIKQAYVDLKAPVGNGLDLKMGVFDTIIGYEVFDSASNPNFTRSYGYTIEPTTHTGLLGSYTVNSVLSFSAGVANTYGPVINGRANPGAPFAGGAVTGTQAESYKTYLASTTLTAPKDWGFISGSTLTGVIINGYNNAIGADQTSFYGGAALNTPLKELKVGASYDYVGITKNHAAASSAYQNATGLYGTYQASEKLSLNLRGEYFSQSGPLAAASVNGFTGTVLPREAIEGTATVQYDLWKNVISRVEFRWDRNVGGGVGTATNPGFGAAGNQKNAFEVIGNVIYKF